MPRLRKAASRVKTFWYAQSYPVRGAISAVGTPLVLIGLTVLVYQVRNAHRSFEYYVGASQMVAPHGESEEKDIDRSCTPFWQNLAILDLNRFNHEVYSFDYALNKDRALQSLKHLLGRSREIRNERSCPDLPDWHYLRKLDEAFEKDCGLVVGTITRKRKLNDGDLYECFNSLLRYRFHITAFFTRNEPLTSLSDMRTLTNRFFAIGLLNDASRAGELSETLDRMRQVDPQNWEVVYALAQTRYIDLMLNQKSEAGRIQAEQKLESVLSAAESLNPSSIGVMELRIYVSRYRNDIETMRKLATELNTLNPNDYTGPYYLAWVSFLQGKEKEAEGALREALSRDPFAFRVRHSLTKLLTLGVELPDISVFNEEIGNFGVHYNLSARSPNIAYGLGFRLWPWPLFRGPTPEVETLIAIQAGKIDVKTLSRKELQNLLSAPPRIPAERP